MSDPVNRRSLHRSLIILACHLTAAIATTIAAALTSAIATAIATGNSKSIHRSAQDQQESQENTTILRSVE